MLATISSNFASECEKSTKNEATSLPFIKHSLSIGQETIDKHKKLLVLSIGGSIYNRAEVKLLGNKIELIDKKHGKLPLFSSGKEFINFLDGLHHGQYHLICINFAYPLQPISINGKLDGKLISGSKEHSFKGLVGKVVGEEVESFIEKKYQKKSVVSVANDTICLLLSGLTEYKWDQLAAGIVGTGLNFAIFEDENTTVNLESANFDKFEQSHEGKEIDMQSVQPGKALFEKEVSGAYLYKHYNLLAQGKNFPTLSSTEELDALAQNGTSEQQKIAQLVLNRSAQLVATQITGILEFQQRDLVFIMQGSLFWKGYNYKQTVEETVKQLTNYKADYIQIENSDLLGAAKLVI